MDIKPLLELTVYRKMEKLITIQKKEKSVIANWGGLRYMLPGDIEKPNLIQGLRQGLPKDVTFVSILREKWVKEWASLEEGTWD